MSGYNEYPLLQPSVIIYRDKYASLGTSAQNNKPYYRAFIDGTTPKITPVSGVTAIYRGSDTTGTNDVPPLDELTWIDAANDPTNTNYGRPYFQSYAEAPKWVAATFNALPTVP